MKKNPHQNFVRELHKQLVPAAKDQDDLLQDNSVPSENDEEWRAVMDEIERTFSELFDSLDDD